MCIRDRKRLLKPWLQIIIWLIFRMLCKVLFWRIIGVGELFNCLLYTSGRCRRIERCPSRGLGDVYKRQKAFVEAVVADHYLADIPDVVQGLVLADNRCRGAFQLSLIHIWTLPTNREVSVSWARRCV